jgi:hypothetical protein
MGNATPGRMALRECLELHWFEREPIHLTICDRCALLARHLAFIRKVSGSTRENGEGISKAFLSANARRCIKDAVRRAARPDEERNRE